MKPIKFKEYNVLYAEDQPEYIPLPALKLETPNGDVITCWKMTIWERLKVLFTGKIWVGMLTFNKPLTPSILTIRKEDLFNTKSEDEV